MNIRLITLPLHTNYGGILQNYALCKVLSSNGHNVKSIKWTGKQFRLSKLRKPLVYLKRLLKKQEIRYEKRMQLEYPIISRKLQRFVQKHIPQTEETFTNETILNIYLKNKSIDVIVYGSDQIWRKTYKNKSILNKLFTQQNVPNLKTYFGSFLKSNTFVKQITYGASFGVDYAEYNQKEQKEIGKLLQKFDAISVREDSGITLINEIYKWNLQVEKVLDPTLLLSKEEYQSIITTSSTSKPVSDIYFYLLDQSLENIILKEKIERIHKSKTHAIVLNENNASVPLEERILPSIEQWLRNIADAKYVVTDSFHGMVFCIIFNTPFCVLGNSKRGNARFISLLKMIGLESRFCTTHEEVLNEISKPIDWKEVNEKLDCERSKSLSFLLKHLN